MKSHKYQTIPVIQFSAERERRKTSTVVLPYRIVRRHFTRLTNGFSKITGEPLSGFRAHVRVAQFQWEAIDNEGIKQQSPVDWKITPGRSENTLEELAKFRNRLEAEWPRRDIALGDLFVFGTRASSK